MVSIVGEPQRPCSAVPVRQERPFMPDLRISLQDSVARSYQMADTWPKPIPCWACSSRHPRERYERTLDQALSDRATGIFERIGARSTGVFRDSPACCLMCTAIDQGASAAHYRRSHLIAACRVCPEHGTVLTTCCESCGAPFGFADLPSLECR